MIALLNNLYKGLASVNILLSRILQNLLMLVAAILVIDVLWGVFSRFVLGAQSTWTEELARFMLIWIALLGASLAFRQNQHLGVDVLTNQLDAKVQKVVAIVVDILILIFATSILIFGGLAVVLSSHAMGQTLVALPLSKATMYAILPISGLLVFSFVLEQLLASTITFGRHSSDYSAEGQR